MGRLTGLQFLAILLAMPPALALGNPSFDISIVRLLSPALGEHRTELHCQLKNNHYKCLKTTKSGEDHQKQMITLAKDAARKMQDQAVLYFTTYQSQSNDTYPGKHMLRLNYESSDKKYSRETDIRDQVEVQSATNLVVELEKLVEDK